MDDIEQKLRTQDLARERKAAPFLFWYYTFWLAGHIYSDCPRRSWWMNRNELIALVGDEAMVGISFFSFLLALMTKRYLYWGGICIIMYLAALAIYWAIDRAHENCPPCNSPEYRLGFGYIEQPKPK